MDRTFATPRTLADAIRCYSDPDRCLAVMVEVRWPKGVACPTCGTKRVRFISTRRMWECTERHPRKQFSVKVGTIFEDSPLSLDTWLAAVWTIGNCKNGISSYEIARALGITQKSAWFMLHRIRAAMHSGTFVKMKGRVEAKKRPPESEEHSRFKDLLRKIVAIPKKEADEKMKEYREQRDERKARRDA